MIDLRSDTVTQPTAAMREAMYHAEVGDDVYGEDPTVNRLEAMAAERLGKEAALYLLSGTMGNLVGILSQTRRGDEAIVGEYSHIFLNEAGGAAALGGVQLLPIATRRGTMDPATVESSIRAKDNVHFPRSALVCMENTANKDGGAVVPIANMNAVAEVAHRHGLRMHLDGARLFNATVALGVPASTVVEQIDSVTFCLSKGLGCPVGSILAGSAAQIEEARRWRKMIGGSLRQSGVVAAAGSSPSKRWSTAWPKTTATRGASPRASPSSPGSPSTRRRWRRTSSSSTSTRAASIPGSSSPDSPSGG